MPLPFPYKLHNMLEDTAKNGQDHIVSWLPHGKAFLVHRPEEFTSLVLPRYFKQTKYKSFQRQLHIYGFRRIGSKSITDFGAYYHDKFIRGEQDSSLTMTRQTIKGPNRTTSMDHMDDPDFYKDMNKDDEKDVCRVVMPCKVIIPEPINSKSRGGTVLISGEQETNEDGAEEPLPLFFSSIMSCPQNTHFSSRQTIVPNMEMNRLKPTESMLPDVYQFSSCPNLLLSFLEEEDTKEDAMFFEGKRFFPLEDEHC